MADLVRSICRFDKPRRPAPPPAVAHDPVSRRRTFAIISRPDADKTTLVEKLLLFGGAIQLASEVRAMANRRQTRPDCPPRRRGHIGWLAAFAGFDLPASSAATLRLLGWHSTGPGLISDLEAMREPEA